MSEYPIFNNKPIDQWKVTELKEELRRRKISVTGLKQELVRKLDEALRNEMEAEKKVENDDLEPVKDCPDDGQMDKDLLPAEDHHDITADAMEKPESTAAIVDIIVSVANVGHGIKDQDGETVPVSGAETLHVSETDTVVMGATETVALEESEHAMLGATETVVLEETEHAMLVEENAAESQSTITHTDSNHLDSTCIEKVENLIAAVEDTNHSLSEPDNQVPVVSPDLGSQVKSEFISTDSVSIIEKNKLKDNLNSDHFHLELEVEPEMVQPSSSTIPLLGGDLHPEKDGEEQVKDLSSFDDIDAKNITDLDAKIEDSVDGVSPEKLNLDRSSSDESMEEDLLETKSAIPSIKSENLKEPTDEVNKASAGEEQSHSVAIVSVTVQGKTDYIDEDKIKLSSPLEKRKLEDNAAVGDNGPVKRQRRWNLETVKLPEQQTSKLSTSSMPKDAFQPIHKSTFTRTGSKLNEDSPKERIVPPSQKPATNSLRIDKFVRPFTLKAVQEMLSKTGTIYSFWMDHIKTHCYVTFETVEQATMTRNAVYNLRWPANGGNLLIAEFVDPQEVKARAEVPPQSQVPISPNPSKSKAPHFQQSQPNQGRQNSLQQLPPPPIPQQTNPPMKEQLPPPPPLPKKPEPAPALTLDDLFKKTKATPRIYYLPLTDEQVAARLAAQAGSTRG